MPDTRVKQYQRKRLITRRESSKQSRVARRYDLAQRSAAEKTSFREKKQDVFDEICALHDAVNSNPPLWLPLELKSAGTRPRPIRGGVGPLGSNHEPVGSFGQSRTCGLQLERQTRSGLNRTPWCLPEPSTYLISHLFGDISIVDREKYPLKFCDSPHQVASFSCKTALDSMPCAVTGETVVTKGCPFVAWSLRSSSTNYLLGFITAK